MLSVSPADLAANGKKPVVALYSTFMQRAVDQMIINVALPKLDVVFAIDRAGIVGADGPTHHGVFDLVYARMVPNMRVLAPSNEAELVHALHTALAMGGPFAIRYPRGEGEGVPLPEAAEVLPEGKGRVVREGEDVAILAFGRMVGQALGSCRYACRAGGFRSCGGHALGQAAGCAGYSSCRRNEAGRHGGGGRYRRRRR